MTAKFKQLKDDKNLSEKEGFGTMVISSFIIVGLGVSMIKLLNVNPYVTVLTMLALAWIGRPLTRKLFGDYAKQDDFTGELTFDTTSITWTKDNSGLVLSCADMISPNLKYNYIQGHQFAILWLFKVWFSTTTFVVKIATFTKRQNVNTHCNNTIRETAIKTPIPI